MCGIVGVVGNRNATDILMQGLEKLEYRGYDSAGIFVANAHQTNLIKSVGRIADLRAKIGIDVAGSTGIGHTVGQRMANQQRIMPILTRHKLDVLYLFIMV